MARGGSIYRRDLADGSAAWVVMYRSGGRQVKFTVRGSERGRAGRSHEGSRRS